MARKKTPAKPKAPKTPPIEDAVVIEDAEVVDVTPEAGAGKMPDDAPDTGEQTAPETAAEGVEDTISDEASATPDDADMADAVPVVPLEPESPGRKSGFIPMVIGGIIAGGIGYGAATYLPAVLNADEGVDPIAPIAELQNNQAAQIDLLNAQVEQLLARPAAPDLSSDVEGIAGDVSRIDGVLEGVSETTTALAARIDEIEKRPLTEGASPQAVEAYERELNALREAINVQRAQIEKVAADAAAQIEAAKAEAASLEASAEEVSQNGIARAAVGRVLAALESGGTYGAALGELQSVSDAEIPAVLVDNAERGIATLARLNAAYPDAARAALAASRQSDGPGEGENAVSAFFKSQLGVRSTTPQAGNSADAILSRVEGAVTDGRLTDAIAEISALSDAAQAPLSDWVNTAQTRIDALAAADALSTSLSTN